MPSARVWLLTALGVLLTMSLLMVASASIPFAMKHELYPMRFFVSQLAYMLIACMVGGILYQLPLSVFYRISTFVPVAAFIVVLLVLTLLFGMDIKGAKRWLNVAGFSFQAAEFVKVFLVLVVAEFMVRRSGEVRVAMLSAVRLALWYAPFGLLLIMQPDYGSFAVIMATLMVMFFVGGAPFKQYAVLAVVGVVLLGVTAMSADYRQTRIMSFLDPFDDVQDSDYQLARSLVAYGRGELSGVGYGNSLLKLEHLPEAHNDFLLAVVGEELGFIGVSLVILLEVIIISSIMRISYNTLMRHQLRLSYTCFGFGVVIFGQVLINAGMTMGLLPTKGLTLPFFSYGGSAMLFSIIMIAIVLKIDKQSPSIAANGNNRDY
ncbi:MAG: putative peptidoglycan glycosyltransferase FtsW [Moraxella sp.]|nr:putative peptidoglycan glycosyltransferase FtsW [Moraxella sp.]